MEATIGAAVLTSIVAASRLMPAEPGQRDRDRQTRAHDRPEGQHQDEQGGHDADQLTLAAHRCGGGVGQVATELDLDAGVAGRRDRLVQGSEVLVEVLVGDRRVVLHGEHGRVAVGTEPGPAHRDDVVHLLEAVGQGGDDRRAEGGAVPVVHDHAGAGVAGARRVLAQLVDADLGAGGGDVPVVLRRAADAAGEGEDADGREHPGGDRPPGVGRRGAAETVEEA
jgi:hypothetical protein